MGNHSGAPGITGIVFDVRGGRDVFARSIRTELRHVDRNDTVREINNDTRSTPNDAQMRSVNRDTRQMPLVTDFNGERFGRMHRNNLRLDRPLRESENKRAIRASNFYMSRRSGGAKRVCAAIAFNKPRNRARPFEFRTLTDYDVVFGVDRLADRRERPIDGYRRRESRFGERPRERASGRNRRRVGYDRF